ncbi:MAG: hypothetical protein ABI831_14260 [Betaproteobacteria bacterium]
MGKFGSIGRLQAGIPGALMYHYGGVFLERWANELDVPNRTDKVIVILSASMRRWIDVQRGFTTPKENKTP